MVGCMRDRRRITCGTAETSQATVACCPNARRMAQPLQKHRVSFTIFLDSIKNQTDDSLLFINRQVMNAPFARRPIVTGYSSDGDTDEE